MINVNILCVGNLKEKWLREAAAEYEKRLSRFCRLTVIELPEQTPEKEKEKILSKMKGYNIALCVEGTQMTSEALAEKMDKLTMQTSEITFIIGSSEGLAAEVKQKANFKLSFSEFTFPHQLMRVILLEQIYRAFTIQNNITYHK